MVAITTVQMKDHERKMLISSIRHSIKAVNVKFEKYSGIVLRSDLDEREQANFDTLRNTRYTYQKMLETLENLEVV